MAGGCHKNQMHYYYCYCYYDDLLAKHTQPRNEKHLCYVRNGEKTNALFSITRRKIAIIRQALISNRLSIGCENMCIYLSQQCHR